MCLSLIKQTIDKPTDKIVTAWKSFGRKYDVYGQLVGLYTRQDGKPVKPGIWLKAKKQVIDSSDGKYITCNACGNRALKRKTYTTGFHGYTKKRHGYNLVRVEFRKVRTIGTQDRASVLVADEMRVPKDWKKYIK